MTKEIISVLLLMTVAVTAFAGEDRIEVASIDKDYPLRTKKVFTLPSVTEKYEYYEIRGDSEKEMRSQMRQNGPVWNDGRKYHSITSWYWKWDYGNDHSSLDCSVDSFRVTLEITYRYPKWVRTDDAPQPLVDKWDGYMKNLITHEQGHRDLAVEAAADFCRAVAKLPPVLSCADLNREVRALSRERMDQLNANEQEYDATTCHGTTQGALFP